MILIPNCSEAICRIKVSNLDSNEINKLKNKLEILGKEKECDGGDSNKFWDSTIFGMDIISADGDFPYNCQEEIGNAIIELGKRFNKKIEYEITDS